MQTPLDLAHDYQARGMAVLPVEYKGKRPSHNGHLLKNWQNLRPTVDELLTYFGNGPQNIGVLLGDPSGHLVDVDHDCPEALIIAPLLLPPTNSTFGRASRRRSHNLYYADLTTKKYCDPLVKDEHKAMLVELRSTGTQTVFPGSVHESGEEIEWDTDGDPAHITAHELERAVAEEAAACLLARYWSDGSRNDAALALAGGLLRAGWAEDKTMRFIEVICLAARDDETPSRLLTVVGTATKLADGAHVTGWTRLGEIIDKRIVDRVRQWLEIRKSASGPYDEESSGLIWHKPTKDGSLPVQLTNFTARVVADVVEDDGVEVQRLFEVEATLNGRRSSGRVSASQFAAMRWPIEILGAQAIIFPNMADHTRCAVQLLSHEIQTRQVYTHTGWREIDGEYCYLHAGGAICAEGTSAAAVRLPPALSALALPNPPEGADLAEALLACLRTLDVADPLVSVPTFGAAWAAALGSVDFSLHLAGQTGTGKTQIAALVQAHYGKGFNSLNLPGSWSSTGNSLEALAYSAKDAVFVIDDFAPTGTAQDVSRMHREADRIFRAQGNHSGRQRMRADTSLRSAKSPRGLTFSTGEDVPRGQSVRARLVTVEMDEETLNWNLLTECQREAREGLYAAAMSGFLRWLAPHYTEVQAQAAKELIEIRERYGSPQSGHKRTPNNIAHLLRGWEYFATFARDTGVLTTEAAEELMARIWRHLIEVAKRQADHQTTQDPALRFLELLTASLASGRAHIADREGTAPENEVAWGWRRATVGNGADMRDEWRPQGRRVGWIDGEHLYLQPDAAFAAAQEMGNSTGDALCVTPQTLWKRLHNRKLLASTEPQRRTLKIRRTIEGRSAHVIHLQTTQLLRGVSLATNADNAAKIDEEATAIC